MDHFSMGAHFGHKLRKLREACGLSQRELADLCELPQASVSRWEKGVNEPKWSDVLKLANALRARLDDFRGDISAPTPPPRRGLKDKKKTE